MGKQEKQKCNDTFALDLTCESITFHDIYNKMLGANKTISDITNENDCVSSYDIKPYKKDENMKKDFTIVDYRTYENRVVIVTFEDSKGNKTDIKSVCNKEDKFDLDRGIEICVCKFLYGEDTYKSIVRSAMKQVKAVDKQKEENKKQEELIARKKAKAAKKKEKRTEKQRQKRINEMKEAFFGALVQHDSYLEETLYNEDYK